MHEAEERQHINNSNFHPLDGDSFRGLVSLKPHDLRHTAAKLRRNNGASIEDVSALLGQRSIATTATYLARMEGEEDPGWEGVAAALGV